MFTDAGHVLSGGDGSGQDFAVYLAVAIRLAGGLVFTVVL